MYLSTLIFTVLNLPSEIRSQLSHEDPTFAAPHPHTNLASNLLFILSTIDNKSLIPTEVACGPSDAIAGAFVVRLLSASLLDFIDSRISPSLSGSRGMTADCVIVGEEGELRGVAGVADNEDGGGVCSAVS
jgi:hypothetical protein